MKNSGGIELADYIMLIIAFICLVASVFFWTKLMNDEALLEKHQQTEIQTGVENIQYIMILEGRWPAGMFARYAENNCDYENMIIDMFESFGYTQKEYEKLDIDDEDLQAVKNMMGWNNEKS